MKQSRLDYMDLAKGIGILAVILGHVYKDTVFGTLLYSFHLPLFFLIAGYFFHDTPDFGTFLMKKLKSYLLPYAGCSLLLAGFHFVYSKGDLISTGRMLLKFLVQKRYSTLWFLATLLAAEILFWFVCRFCEKKLNLLVFLCVSVSVVFMLFDNLTEISLYWNLDTAFVVLLYLAVGYAMQKKDLLSRFIKNRHKSACLFVLSLSSLSLTGINLLMGFDSLEMFNNHYGCFPLTSAAAITGSLFVILLCSCFSSKILIFLGQNTFPFFAFHQDIGMVAAHWLLWKFSISGWIYAPATFILAMVICTLIYFILTRLHLGFLIGK